MCGIAAIVSRSAFPDRADAIKLMCDAIAHRGPDDWGSITKGQATLGMRRLSIIDVAGGHQPIANENKSVWVVFNGEIYNHHRLRAQLVAAGHTFRTRSDTEVIIHGYEQWGLDIANHLEGMFAFAIWDCDARKLIAARDHLGIKPLYYWPLTDGVALGSELRCFLALREFPRTLSHAAIMAFSALGYVPQDACIFQNAVKLQPGSVLVWDEDAGLRVQRFWNPLCRAEENLTEHEAIVHLRSLLEDAVAAQMEAEVPLGAFLSGGLDSSTVVALMTRYAPGRVRTFSIGFEEAEFNESDQAAMVASQLGTRHTALTLAPSAEALIDRTIVAYDEPFADASAIPTYLVSILAREGVTVALSGDGGDELFAGYPWHAALAFRERPSRLAWPARVAAALIPVGTRGRSRLLDHWGGREARFNARHADALLVEDGGLVRPQAGTKVPGVTDWFQNTWSQIRERDFVSQMALVDLSHYLPDDILTKVDRTSMGVSLEVRPPLLHVPLVEFAISLPGSLKVRGGVGKFILRKAVEDLVPAGVTGYAKRGFSVPMNRWLRRELKGRLAAVPSLAMELPGVFDESALRHLVDEHLSGRRDHGGRLWRCLVLRRWLDHLARGDLSKATTRLSLSDLATVRRQDDAA